MRTFIVPVTIAEERRVTVKARTADEAIRRVKEGHYVRLGRATNRGFLLVGEAEEANDDR